jgi:hypothetical protein
MRRSDTAILPPRQLEAATVTALRTVANRFGGADGARSLALLRAAAGLAEAARITLASSGARTPGVAV